jgi:hypothetical protein
LQFSTWRCINGINRRCHLCFRLIADARFPSWSLFSRTSSTIPLFVCVFS